MVRRGLALKGVPFTSLSKLVVLIEVVIRKVMFPPSLLISGTATLETMKEVCIGKSIGISFGSSKLRCWHRLDFGPERDFLNHRKFQKCQTNQRSLSATPCECFCTIVGSLERSVASFIRFHRRGFIMCRACFGIGTLEWERKNQDTNHFGAPTPNSDTSHTNARVRGRSGEVC